jgi:hypothetical protein
MHLLAEVSSGMFLEPSMLMPVGTLEIPLVCVRFICNVSGTFHADASGNAQDTAGMCVLGLAACEVSPDSCPGCW